MLDVNTLYASTAGTTAAYYTAYLAPGGSGERPGLWQGRGAVELGLAGEVSTEKLEALLSGHHPASGELLGTRFVDRIDKHGDLIQAVCGFDATFSAPKSVSVLWALTGDDGWRAAHDLAVQAVLEHIERYGSTSRVRVKGPRSYPDTRGLTMAVFPQSTSREDDPQLHTHCIISSKVQLADGRWYALDGSYVKDHQRDLGGLYQSVLRAELSARYGVAWGMIEKGQAEIAGIPDEVLSLFSKRTRQVEQLRDLLLMAFRETEGRDPTRREHAAISRQAAEDSRQDKTGVPLDELLPRWRAEADAAGWTGRTVLDQARTTARGLDAQNLPTVDAIVDQLSTDASTWSRIDILRAICDLTPVQDGFDGTQWARTLEATTDQLVADQFSLDPPPPGDIVRVSDGRSIWHNPNKPNLTHTRVLEQEDRILTFALDAQDADHSPSGSVDVDGLDTLQAAAARAVAGHDGLVLVVGPAGAGKTTTLERSARDLAGQQRRVLGIAPTAKAARVLETETGIRSDTLAKLLHEWNRPDGPDRAYQLPAGTTVVCDEAGMVGTASLDRLMTLARSQQWRLVLIGDPHQLQAVGRGGMFDELCRIGRTHELATIHRFHHTWEQTATLALRQGRTAVFDTYERHGRIHPGDLDMQLDTIAARWIQHHDRGETVAVTAETNAHVDLLNDTIQHHRREHGHIDPQVAVPIAGEETASPGDRIVTRRNDRHLLDDHGEPVRNREHWNVEAVHPDGALTVTRQHGRGTVRLPADYVAEHVRLGYAATAHGHQGDTVDISYTLVSTATSHRGLYVGATRGRDANHLCVITDEPDLGHARDLLNYTITNDRADTPAVARRRELAEELPAAPTLADQLAGADRRLRQARQRAEPFEQFVRAAEAGLRAARQDVAELRQQLDSARPWARRALKTQLADAVDLQDQAAGRLDQANQAATAPRRHVNEAVEARQPIADLVEAREALERLEHLRRRPAVAQDRSLGL